MAAYTTDGIFGDCDCCCCGCECNEILFELLELKEATFSGGWTYGPALTFHSGSVTTMTASKTAQDPYQCYYPRTNSTGKIHILLNSGGTDYWEVDLGTVPFITGCLGGLWLVSGWSFWNVGGFSGGGLASGGDVEFPPTLQCDPFEYVVYLNGQGYQSKWKITCND